MSTMFDNRTYRQFHRKKGLIPFNVTVRETNLNIQADRDLSEPAMRSVLKYRGFIESFALDHPEFLHAMTPLPVPDIAPEIVREMMAAAKTANVGPMAAVAGALSEFTARDLLIRSDEVVVENGGDIFIKSHTPTTFAVFAGKSPLSLKTGIRIDSLPYAYAVCTSSGTVGHSKSFGTADAVTVFSRSCCLADAVATALGNRISRKADIEPAIHEGKKIPGVAGILIIKGEQIGIWGDMELVPLA